MGLATSSRVTTESLLYWSQSVSLTVLDPMHILWVSMFNVLELPLECLKVVGHCRTLHLGAPWLGLIQLLMLSGQDVVNQNARLTDEEGKGVQIYPRKSAPIQTQKQRSDITDRFGISDWIARATESRLPTFFNATNYQITWLESNCQHYWIEIRLLS